MTIRNPQAFVDQLWDWRFLDRCFTNNIRVSDIDGIIERNGYFLVLESKGPNVPIPHGQMEMFLNMVATGKFSILIIWGQPNTEPVRLQEINRKYTKVHDRASLELMTNIVRQWFRNANVKNL